ncbi:glutamate--cysteine ligase [Endozoicomonas arenosclerae]|uniref:glutamate--cysteine ligase n=1 Tax=Endozoicomonas arenosclerae TaxID=1633495 RepID=UPI000785B485|nr:glutamate--cysteine ligase [Endozoicomonas arenosclerae]
MTSQYESRLQLLQQSSNQNLLSGIRHGIEREGLRVTADARLSQRSHPEVLGKTLTHPYITTDYSEALLEFITPVYCKVEDVMKFLEELHSYTSRNLGGEAIWAGSMPALLEGEQSIPIARYGDSNPGTMKYVYREGLAHRYGKAMQTIAGIHYNFSLPESLWQLLSESEGSDHSLEGFQSESYLAMIRNFRRYSWLLMYLFGASPAVSKSFFTQDSPSEPLEKLDEDTLYMPWATSLRMSDLGYTNNAQSSLSICYNTLGEYVSSLSAAIKTPYEPYEAIGLKSEGNYLQLNTNLLQIENEYYSNIRPKRIAKRGEKPLTALSNYGVEYVEVRCMDINPMEPLGLSTTDAAFLDVFLMFTALMDSPEIGHEECQRVTENFARTVSEGRRPGLTLNDEQGPVVLKDWGLRLIDKMAPMAEMLDQANDSQLFSESLHQQREKLLDAEKTPSAQILQVLKNSGDSYIDWILKQSEVHSGYFSEQNIQPERLEYFARIAEESRADQERLESLDTTDFDEFLKRYFESE